MLKDIGIKKFFLYTFSAIGGVSLISGIFLVIFIKVNVGGLTVKTADNAQKQELLLEQNIHLSSIHGAISTLLTEKDMDKLEKTVGVVNSDFVELEKHYKACGADCEKLLSEFLIYKSKADELINKKILMGKNAEAIEFFIQEQSKVFELMLKTADALSTKNHNDVEVFLESFKKKTLSIILVTVFSSLFLQLAVIYAIRSSRKMIHVLSEKIAELSGKGHDVDSSAAKLSNVSGDLAATVHEQAAAIQESVAAMEEMSSMLHQTNEMTKNACELSEHIKNHADEGKNTISI